MPDAPSPLLFGTLTADEFLRTYWQKKPLLVRQAFPGFRSPLSPQDLALLACEEPVTSRLILERGGDYPWQLRYGPFDPEDFEALPPTHWTLLVQEADRHVPEVAALLDSFRFVPNWRLDDIMISYAPGEGGVGAHVDNYDVFLLQGWGQRRWQINHAPVREEHLVPDLDVSILADFEADAEWVLEPGDLLYLPPRIPHYGVALGDCMTLSIGLRAPSMLDLSLGLLDHLAQTIDPLARYADPDLKVQSHPGEITAKARTRIRTMVRGLLANDHLIDRWFGRFITEPRRSLGESFPDHEMSVASLRRAFTRSAVLHRSAIADLAYMRLGNGQLVLFVAGEEYPLAPTQESLAQLITGDQRLDASSLGPHLAVKPSAQLLVDLVNTGHLYLDAD